MTCSRLNYPVDPAPSAVSVEFVAEKVFGTDTGCSNTSGLFLASYNSTAVESS